MTIYTLAALVIIPLLGVVCFYVIPSQPPVQPCIESCPCTTEDTDWGSAVNIQCGKRNLTSVPRTINDKPVSLLNVSLNVLKTLEVEALSGYESVRYLYLQSCKIVNINQKAFQRLENLTEIDLSSNHLTSVPPNLFNGNQKLNKLILRNNNLGSLQENTPILNGPPSLSILDLQSCRLSNISPITFSLLLNLTFIDISRNKLVLLKPDTLSSHQKLKDVNLENNPWQCGTVFNSLLCWMQSRLALSHGRTVKCQYLNGMFDIWTPEKRSSLCRPITTPSTREFVTVMTPHLTTVSVVVPPSPETSPHTSRVVETAVTSKAELGDLPESETRGWASLLSWNFNTLTVFVILPITLGGAIFVSLKAVNYIVKSRMDRRTRHDNQGEDNHVSAFSSNAPLLNTQLTADITKQHAGYENRSSENVRHNENHIFEEIR